MLNRKEFLTGVAGVTVTLIVSACGSDDSQSGAVAGDGDCTNGINTSITGNHGHILDVPVVDFAAGQSKTYSIKGTSDHDHSMTLTADDFANLNSGKTVTKESTTNSGHSHSMQMIC
jgi:hypothetical protein